MSKRPRRFTGLQVAARLRSIDEDDSGRESQTEEGDVLDWKLRYSNEVRDDKETEQLMIHNPLFMKVIYKLLILTLKPILLHILMMILIRVLLKV